MSYNHQKERIDVARVIKVQRPVYNFVY